MLPTSVLASLAGLGALFVTSADVGTTLPLTIDADVSTGAITGFDGLAAFCGHAHLTSGGDAVVGGATIAAAFLDAGDVSKVQTAGSRQVCANVHSIGTVASGGGQPDIGTTVSLRIDPVRTVTAPPTSTEPASTTALAPERTTSATSSSLARSSSWRSPPAPGDA